MNKEINTLQEVKVEMKDIQNQLMSDKDKTYKELVEINAVIEYIGASKYIPDDIKNQELKVLNTKATGLVCKMLSYVTNDLKEIK